MDKLQATAEQKGKSSFDFAYYLDTCEERKRGVTIQCKTKEFFTDKYHYTIVDAPGHKDYIKNMITGSFAADVGLLLVSAEKGGFEAAIAKADAKMGVEEGQTRQHARLLYLLGVEQIIVGINKMDACGWDEGRFNEIKDEFVKMLQLIGFKPEQIPFIPLSGFNGDNLLEKSDKCLWYKGWSANNPKTQISGFTLSEALDNFIVPPKRKPTLPVRIPISDIGNIEGVGQIFGGPVTQGTLKPSDVISFVNSGIKEKTVFTMEQHKKRLKSAGPGDHVCLSIKGVATDEKVKHGDVIYMQKEGALKPIKSFRVMVAVQEHPGGVLKPGYCPIIFCGTGHACCRMTKIYWKKGRKTGGVKVENPTELSQYENAEVEFVPMKPLFVESFFDYPALGRVAIMDSNKLKMLGKVTATTTD